MSRLSEKKQSKLNPSRIRDHLANERTYLAWMRSTREIAEAFVEFLYTPEAQTAFAEAGFRPVNEEVFAEFGDRFPVVENLFTIEDFGGWSQAQPEFFDDGAIFDQALLGR